MPNFLDTPRWTNLDGREVSAQEFITVTNQDPNTLPRRNGLYYNADGFNIMEAVTDLTMHTNFVEVKATTYPGGVKLQTPVVIQTAVGVLGDDTGLPVTLSRYSYVNSFLVMLWSDWVRHEIYEHNIKGRIAITNLSPTRYANLIFSWIDNNPRSYAQDGWGSFFNSVRGYSKNGEISLVVTGTISAISSNTCYPIVEMRILPADYDTSYIMFTYLTQSFETANYNIPSTLISSDSSEIWTDVTKRLG